MAAHIRAFDWSQSPIGPPEAWSPALRTSLSLLLANRFPMLLWWGPEYISIYNDAYRPILGAKHPWALGKPVGECWSEIWHVLKPLIDTPFQGGPATWDEDITLEINRHGFVEETHFTVAYSPVPDESAAGGIGGVLATVHETTAKIVGERRVLALRDLGAHVGEARTAEEACAIAARALLAHDRDIPFALFYLFSADHTYARFAGATGVEAGRDLSPFRIELEDDGEAAWPVGEVRRTDSRRIIEDLQRRFREVPGGPWSDPPSAAVVLPIASSKAGEPAGVLIAGVSARLKLDAYYHDFLGLVSTQVATAISHARAYEADRRRAEALAELDRAKTAFFSNVSHEFRTPLTLMLGPVEEVLADGDMSPQARERLDLAHRNALRLQKLVNSLLDFSRIEAGRVQACYEPMDLAALTRDLASTFRSTIERAGLRFEVGCPRLSEPVHVDREMWEKIVLNLLSNAFKFTLEGGIALRLREEQGAAVLELSDTGVGIPPEEMPRLFERFHRIESSAGRTHEGSGIGLALVQELVRLHGGSIEARSAPGRGTTFTVRIPLGSAHLPRDRLRAPRTSVSTSAGAQAFVQEALRWLPENTRSDTAPGSARARVEDESLQEDRRFVATFGARIVLADDNADMRAYLRELLEPCYAVEAVADGEAALEAIRRERPALLISDVMMPRLDGFGLLRELRADGALRSLPVILLSARAGEDSRIEGLDAGADDYLVKPFSARELLARVGAMLERAQLRAESDEKLATVLEQLPIGVGLLDRNGRWVISSAAMRALVPEMIPSRDPARRARWKLLDATGQPVPPDRWPGARALCGETVWPGVEALYTTETGEEIWMRVSATPLRDASERIEGVICVVENIDASRRAAESIRESEVRFRALVEASSNAIYRMSPDWSEMRHLVGRDFIADTLDPSRTWLDKYIHPDDQPQVTEAIRRAIHARSTFELEHRVLRVDGSIGWTFSRAIPLLDAAGEIVEWLGTASDVTERKHVEEQLRERAEELQMVLDTVPAAILIAHDPAARDITGNRTSYELLRLPEGVNASLTAPDDAERPTGFRVFQGGRELSPDELPVQVAAATGAVVERFEEELRFDDGTSIALYGNAVPLRDPRGQVRGAVAAFVDVTHAKRAEARLAELAREREALLEAERAARSEAESANRLKDEFLATLSHELRTPLSVIVSWSRVLLRKHAGENAELKQGLKFIVENAMAQSQMIGELLDMSRIVAGKTTLELKPLDLAELVDACVAGHQPTALEKGIELAVRHAGVPKIVYGDPARLQQVLGNLLANAFKFTPRGGRVEMSTRLSGKGFEIAVQDTGEGIAPEFLPHLFGRFRQGDGSSARKHGGLGIGLAIVRQIVEMHGGQVRAESEGAGRGARFTVWLPAVAPVETTTALEQSGSWELEPQALGPGSLQGLQVLAVEDEPAMLEFLVRVLEEHGAGVVAARSGEEASCLLREGTARSDLPHILVCDIGMPGMDGHALLRAVRGKLGISSERLPAIAVTAFAREEDRRRALEAGFQVHLSKPYQVAQLVASISQLCGRGATSLS